MMQQQPEWVKSSLSYANGNCVEVTGLPGGHVAVRNSREPDGPVLRFTRGEWRDFIAGARNGEFDLFGGGDGTTAAAGQEREAQEHARDMAAEDGDHDRCEPTL